MIAAIVVALILATLFTGIALYITLVEHPVRFGLGNVVSVAQWQASYRRAFPLQAGLAVGSGVAGLVAWMTTHDWRLLAGSLVLLANWPFTLLVIRPLNKRLLGLRPNEGNAKSTRLLVQWGWLHGVRGLLGIVATALLAWAVIGDVLGMGA